ncbi:hypothetical protein [Streptomyces sp. A30]|uniref:Uncharacterized protein n=1 Tax=Streptomyces plumbiresistens TaxID=511811 RepID=A0ABP7QII4_9ACTN
MNAEVRVVGLAARESGEFVGRVGLDEVDEDMPFTGVDTGWRLPRPSATDVPGQ